jgi:hypothetical protein
MSVFVDESLIFMSIFEINTRISIKKKIGPNWFSDDRENIDHRQMATN